MNIEPFAVEEWMNEHEVGARFNIAETCVDSVSLDELFALTGEDKAQFVPRVAQTRRQPTTLKNLPTVITTFPKKA